MANAPYSGDETDLDRSWDEVTDAHAPNGETVGGTTTDDLCTETTTVGTDADTPLQRQIKTDHFCHPGASYGEIADRVGCSPAYVQQTLGTSDGQYLRHERFADLTESQQRIIELAVHDNGLKQCDIAARLDVSDPYVSQVLSHNEHIVAAVKGGEVDR